MRYIKIDNLSMKLLSRIEWLKFGAVFYKLLNNTREFTHTNYNSENIYQKFGSYDYKYHILLYIIDQGM